MEIEEKEKEIHFAAMEEQRQKIYQNLYEEHHRKEIEIAELFDEKDNSKSRPNQIQSNVIDELAKIDQHGDSTDDEFFEMPLPPIPQSPPRTGKLSIVDNAEVAAVTASVQETPKVNNLPNKFKFPLPLGKKKFDASILPPIPPRPSSISPPTSPKADQHDSEQAVITDFTPKSLLQSDF